MSAPLRLTLDDLGNLGLFLADVSEATRQHGVRIDAYDAAQVEVAGCAIRVKWDAETEQYVIDDQIGG